jgi:hypothetical protein
LGVKSQKNTRSNQLVLVTGSTARPGLNATGKFFLGGTPSGEFSGDLQIMSVRSAKARERIQQFAEILGEIYHA